MDKHAAQLAVIFSQGIQGFGGTSVVKGGQPFLFPPSFTLNTSCTNRPRPLPRPQPIPSVGPEGETFLRPGKEESHQLEFWESKKANEVQAGAMDQERATMWNEVVSKWSHGEDSKAYKLPCACVLKTQNLHLIKTSKPTQSQCLIFITSLQKQTTKTSC